MQLCRKDTDLLCLPTAIRIADGVRESCFMAVPLLADLAATQLRIVLDSSTRWRA